MGIKILDPNLINKIAAGEVIERPSSVVKELIENSIDANSDIIKIEIEQYGKSRISITDNGIGMSKDDLKKCIIKHATSKLESETDLFKIATLGFRGEALASMCSIAKVQIQSKTNEQTQGSKITVENGEILKQEDIGMPNGTTIIIEDLFYNTPVRLKHLKQNQTELGHIINTVTKYAIINHNKSFTLIHNGKIILNSPKATNLKNNLVSIYDKNIVKELVEINFTNEFGTITGFVSKPSITRAEKTEQSIYVNKRYIKNKTISDALYDAFHSLLFLSRHPIAIINVDIDITKTDVNVHPAKEIIRIEHEEKLYDLVYNAIRNTLEKNNLIPEAQIKYNTKIRESTKVYSKTPETQQQLETETQYKPITKQNTQTLQYDRQKVTYTEEIKPVKEAKFVIRKIHNQINNMYILCEDDNGLIIFDQHVVEERVNYEKFMEYFKNKNIPKQNLLQPQIINTTPQEYKTILNNIEMIEKLGFDIEDYGNNSIIIRSAPSILGEIDPTFITDLIEEINTISKKKLLEKMEEKIIMFSCKRSIKAGKILTLPQMHKMIEELRYADNPFTCPHGRPVMLRISYSEIEKMFKRTG